MLAACLRLELPTETRQPTESGGTSGSKRKK